MSDTFSIERKEVRWVVMQKVSVVYNNQIVAPDATHPLCIKISNAVGTPGETGYQAAVYANIASNDVWIAITTIASFGEAKSKVVELMDTIGLANLRIVKAVDLTTVLYPIA